MESLTMGQSFGIWQKHKNVNLKLVEEQNG